MYVFEQSQAQKYGKIFLIFREISAKMMMKKKKGRIKKSLLRPFICLYNFFSQVKFNSSIAYITNYQ